MMVTRGTAELRVVLYDSGREGGAVLAPILLPLEYSIALGALLFLCVGAEMHYSSGPSEHLRTDFLVPVQIWGCGWRAG